jgi:hypothetical protein
VIREETVQISGEGSVVGVVEDSVFRGPGYLVTVAVAGDIIRVIHHERIATGQTVRLDVPQEGFALLDS